jgi:hypothetical protein
METRGKTKQKRLEEEEAVVIIAIAEESTEGQENTVEGSNHQDLQTAEPDPVLSTENSTMFQEGPHIFSESYAVQTNPGDMQIELTPPPSGSHRLQAKATSTEGGCPEAAVNEMPDDNSSPTRWEVQMPGGSSCRPQHKPIQCPLELPVPGMDSLRVSTKSGGSHWNERPPDARPRMTIGHREWGHTDTFTCPAERTSSSSSQTRFPEHEEYGHGTEYRDLPYERRDRGSYHAGGRPKIQPHQYDGLTSWLDYRQHFEVVADINEWSKPQMGRYLAASLKGTARALLGNFSKQQMADYDYLVHAIGARFSPENMSEMYRTLLTVRVRGTKETIPELGQEIRNLTRQAYPTLPHEAQDILARDHFIDALDDAETRLQVRLCHPTTLNDAVRSALEIETFKESERQGGPVKRPIHRVGVYASQNPTTDMACPINFDWGHAQL